MLRSQWDVSKAVADGRLVRVLADWQFDSAPINLLVPSRKLRSARVQALVSFLEAELKV
ncbi:LysR substrate binding domain protein [compost metagenome]